MAPMTTTMTVPEMAEVVDQAKKRLDELDKCVLQLEALMFLASTTLSDKRLEPVEKIETALRFLRTPVRRG
jgi:hypothetical protein